MTDFGGYIKSGDLSVLAVFFDIQICPIDVDGTCGIQKAPQPYQMIQSCVLFCSIFDLEPPKETAKNIRNTDSEITLASC